MKSEILFENSLYIERFDKHNLFYVKNGLKDGFGLEFHLLSQSFILFMNRSENLKTTLLFLHENVKRSLQKLRIVEQQPIEICLREIC